MKQPLDINLEANEKVKYTFRRSAILNVLIIAGLLLTTFAFAALLIFLRVAPALNEGNYFFSSSSTTRSSMYLITSILYFVIIMAGIISIYVNNANVLIITNLHLIHSSTVTLFSRSVNIIRLQNVEDVSFKEANVLDRLLHIGQLRFSTVGDETTYTFSHVDSPSSSTLSHLSQIINATPTNTNIPSASTDTPPASNTTPSSDATPTDTPSPTEAQPSPSTAS